VSFNGVATPASASDLSLAEGTVVTIPDGATTVLVPVGEIDDLFDEEDVESVVFSVKGPSVNLVLGTTALVTHGITDNDPSPDIHFMTMASNSPESAGTVQLTVQLTAASGRMVRVDYAVGGTSTTSATDVTVTGAPGTLTFMPGEIARNLTATIANDNIDEDDEQLVLTLSNPINATISTQTHTLTINDNDTANVSFQTAANLVDEDIANTVSITVVMSTTNSRNVTVPFTIAGTATSGDDYAVATTSPIVFAPGETAKAIVLNVFNNAPQNELDETVQIDLGSPTNALLATPTRHTLTIIE
jgi:hypothetical protein